MVKKIWQISDEDWALACKETELMGTYYDGIILWIPGLDRALWTQRAYCFAKGMAMARDQERIAKIGKKK